MENEIKGYKPPIIEQVDMSGTWDTQSEIETVINAVKSLDIYKPNLLYSRYSGTPNQARNALNDILFCATEKEFTDTEDPSSPMKYTKFQTSNSAACLAIYDGDKMAKYTDEGYSRYKIEKDNALIAILELKYDSK